MIILDTNVVSEAMKPEPNMLVIEWLNEQAAETMFLSSVTLAELLFGIGLTPSGQRRIALTQSLNGLLELFMDRVLSFDSNAAMHYAELAIIARTAGKGFPTADGYIAAIAKANGFVVATRDTSPFEAVGVRVVNPWEVVRNES